MGIEEIKDLKKNVELIALWQGKIIEELDSFRTRFFSRNSSFSLDVREELKKEYPHLFEEEEEENENVKKD